MKTAFLPFHSPNTLIQHTINHMGCAVHRRHHCIPASEFCSCCSTCPILYLPVFFFSFFSHHCHPGWQLPFLFLPVQLLMSCFLLNVTGVLCWFFVRYKKELSMDSSYVEFAFENQSLRDISGGSVAKTLRSQCRGPGFNPWSGNWIPRATAKDLTCRNKDGRSCMLQLRPSTAKEIKNWWLNWYSVFNDQMTEWMYPLKKKPTDNCNSRKIVTENIHR